MHPIELILIAASLIDIALVLFVLRKTRKNLRAGRKFAWCIFWIAAWTLCIAVITDPNVGQHTALIAARTTFCCGIWAVISWLWFCADFPRPTRHFRIIAIVATIIGVPLTAFCWTNAFIVNVSAYPWFEHMTAGPFFLVFSLWAIVCELLSVIHLTIKGHQMRGIERLQVRYILLGIIALILISTVSDLLLPLLTGGTSYAYWGPLSSLFLVLTTAYAIARYRLMDIRIVLRAGLVYSITIGLLSIIFALVVPLLDDLFNMLFHTHSPAVSFIVAFLMALSYQPLLQRVEEFADRRFFYNGMYDYRSTLREACNALASAHDYQRLTAIIEHAIQRALEPRGIAIYLTERDGQLSQYSATGAWPTLPAKFAPDDPLVLYAGEADDTFVTDELLQGDKRREAIGTGMNAWDAELAVPLSAGQYLCGIIFIGGKPSGEIYTSDDLGLLRILGKQAAIALDNARHYTEMMLMNEYHARLLNTMRDGVVVLDPRGCVITFNPEAERITGVPAGEAIGKRLEQLGLDELPTRGSSDTSQECVIERRGGDEITVLATVTPFLRRWEVTHCRLICFRDITVLRALQHQKRQIERFSSMGAMAASFAHEIQKPLMPIRKFTDMLIDRYDDGEFRNEFCDVVSREVEQINKLVSQMLDLVRKPTTEREEIDIQEVFERLVALLKPECERLGIKVRLNVVPDLPPVVGVAKEMYQAISTLLTNALHAMPDGGKLGIAVTTTGNRVFCRISDSGKGMSKEEISHLFSPQEASKLGGQRLRLALTYQFIRSHGGDLRAESKPGSGLTLIAILPVWQPEHATLIAEPVHSA